MNPFDVLEERLLSIEKLLAELNSKSELQPEEKEDYVEAEEAAQMMHLSIDRFYTIHKKILTSSKPGRKLLFSRKEIQVFLHSKKVKPRSEAINEAEDFRVKRLQRE
jgi:hypothetical protein